MSEQYQTNRTWLCSVLFIDIVDYSSQSVELQIRWKERFNHYLGEAIRNIPQDERVILDTGDGAAICFLGAPEAPMFAAFEFWHFLLHDTPDQPPALRARIGINLGPVKLVRDINGAPNALGDGINAGQRIMSFAAENQILVSQSYFEVVSRLSDDYKVLFTLKGVERDKHIREHTVYTLSPPGAAQIQTAPMAEAHRPPASPALDPPPPQAPSIARPAAPTPGAVRVETRNRRLQLLAAGLVAIVILAAGVWFFYRAERRSMPRTGLPAADPSPVSDESRRPDPAAQQAAEVPASRSKSAPAPDRPSAGLPASSLPVPVDAQASYDTGVRLLEARDDPMQALRYFDDAIRAQPGFLEAYLRRAEARRRLLQYEPSLKDCNKAIQLAPADARGYNCRGYAEQLLMQYDSSLADFGEALRLNPNFGLAYGNRGTTWNLTLQYAFAIKDFNEAIRLLPNNHVFYIRRGNAYRNLKQYARAIQDYTEAIRLSPKSMDAWRARAMAEQAMGDTAAAAADRAHIREENRNGAQ